MRTQPPMFDRRLGIYRLGWGVVRREDSWVVNLLGSFHGRVLVGDRGEMMTSSPSLQSPAWTPETSSSTGDRRGPG
jgi:hypothetical protein